MQDGGCGVKHIFKSKAFNYCKTIQITEGLGALLEFKLLKKRRPLWREARFQVKHVDARNTCRFCSSLHRDGRRTLEEDLRRCSLRGRRNNLTCVFCMVVAIRATHESDM